MDSLDLLAREDEFKKLNKQLEKKTESLMKEIERAMQKQDIFSEFSHNLTLSPEHSSTKKHCCSTTPSPKQNTPTKSKNIIKKTVDKESSKNKTPLNTVHARVAGNHQGSIIEKQGNAEQDTTDKSQDSDSICTNCARRVTCNCCMVSRRERVTEDLEFLYAFVSVNVQDKVLPHSFAKERATVESVCKFLSSKVKLMQEQIDKLQTTINQKASQCEAHLAQQAELEGERMSLLNRANQLRASAAAMKAKKMAVEKKLEEKDSLYKEQRSETDRLTSEAKRLRLKNAGLEARCASQEEVTDNMKHQLEVAKRAEKEFRDSTRGLSASHQTAISRLESRVKCLTTRIDKQNALIDNLRRQNALLSAEGAVKALEEQYSKFLTQDFE